MVDKFRMNYRFASPNDAPVLAPLNQQLIRDEGHRNPMNLAQLTERLVSWLASDYKAVIFEDGALVVGYALFRPEPEYVYLRQLLPTHRRKGIGRAALQWLWANAWDGVERLRIEVLVGNSAGREFWRSVGFQEYCVTMEARTPGSGRAG